MKILQLCKKFPYPLRDGESIAVTNLSRGLSRLGCEITLLCMNTTKHYTDVSNLPDDFNHYKSIHVTEIDNTLNPVDAFKNLFSKDSYHISRFISSEFTDKLVKILTEDTFDIIQLETLYLAPYIDTIRKYSNALIAMRAHNVEHEIWERITENTSLLPKKWYISYLTKKLRRFELASLKHYDYLIPVSEKDLKKFQHMGYKNGALTSPIGIDTSIYEAQKINTEHPSICFIGSLDWMPNLEGLKWFVKNVWTPAVEKFPDLHLNVAGRNAPTDFFPKSTPNFHFYGEVPSATDFINKHTIMIVPLFSGSGMRVKILEGLALGRIIITTTLGLEGINAVHQKEVLVADSADQFLDCINFCYDNPDLLEVISENARKFVNQHFDNEKNASDLKSFYSKLLVAN